ncbi:protein disulfide oxidoreductase [Vibrio rumoiensis]|uniref:Redoxin n=1 Tax=Vibrio rumoiensis 1S-45 TaxID=1188252 RepID=A0A1E5E055_9VIBR|nr:protein disulfide oxidoreductase [Vibrio rumoiensis]OEF23401.1 redoxin [Vibrio rumoiensis 1S-45]
MSTDKVTKSRSKKLLGWLKQLMLWLLFAIVITTAMDLWRGKDIPRDNLPPLQGITLQGKSVDIATLSQDKAVLVYFWATWCSVCNFVSPAVNQISKYYPVVSVAVRSGEDQKLQQYLQYKEYQFETINDNNHRLSSDWSLQVTPTLMVFKNGKLEYYTTGFTSLPGIWWRMFFA